MFPPSVNKVVRVKSTMSLKSKVSIPGFKILTT